MREFLKTESSRIIHVPMGKAVFSNHPEDTLAIFGIGSCIGLALYEPYAKVGGLCHIVLPTYPLTDRKAELSRAADTCVPYLVEGMLNRGARYYHLWAKMVGGASVLSGPEWRLRQPIGDKNIQAVRTALLSAGIRLVAEDTGGNSSRQMWFNIKDGSIETKKLGDKREKL